MSVSGCNGHYKLVLGVGAKAKTVTNNLPILSVLWARPYLSVKLPEICLDEEISFLNFFLLVLLQKFYCYGAMEKNFEILASILQALCQSFGCLAARVALAMCLQT